MSQNCPPQGIRCAELPPENKTVLPAENGGITTTRQNVEITLFLIKRIYLCIFRERGKEGEREGNIHVQETHPPVASHTPPTGDLAHNPGMCPDWESNQRPFRSQAGTQSAEPHQPRHNVGISVHATVQRSPLSPVWPIFVILALPPVP